MPVLRDLIVGARYDEKYIVCFGESTVYMQIQLTVRSFWSNF
jgi:hypothetical protein